MAASKAKKVRADKLLLEKNLAGTISDAQALIGSGSVYAAGVRIAKSGTAIASDTILEVRAREHYVSRGAYKLLHALETFSIEVAGKVCADAGCSTGGFTQVLLERGAACVYAIDSAYGILDWSLRSDARVKVLERKSLASVDSLPQTIEFASVDISLLPLAKIIPTVFSWMPEGASVVALIKPQYEASPDQLPPGAVIRDIAVHRAILTKVITDLSKVEGGIRGLISSPIEGRGGNREFLVWLTKGRNSTHRLDAEVAIENALSG
jgi:23S rRNA (cytidine1920-2'-O)/16S rRNA (cytidine1409-2'-O)-methyltransferase